MIRMQPLLPAALGEGPRLIWLQSPFSRHILLPPPVCTKMLLPDKQGAESPSHTHTARQGILNERFLIRNNLSRRRKEQINAPCTAWGKKSNNWM